MPQRNSNKSSTRIFNPAYVLIFLFILASTKSVYAQQVTEVITDFNGYWKSGIGAINPTYPNTGHNVLSFKYNSVVYSTGVDDSKLAANGISYTGGDFRAFPISTVGGTVTSGGSIYVALASRYDGIPNGYSNPLPSLRIKDVLIDGVHGLDLGTGATNIPASALVSFPISTVITSSIADAKPDIVVSQIALPTSTGDTLYFVNSSGVLVGSKLSINWTAINNLGTYYLDLYSLPNGSLCDTAHISGSADKETTRDIRLLAFTLADFGITAGNASTVAGFVLKASGTSDPAFIAYNNDAFTIPAPVITVHPVTQIVCPNLGNSATFSVTATGGSLTYQWRKNNADISGATNSSYTISNVTSSSAGSYNVVVSNPVGSVVSNTAYLNVAVAVQPSPSSQLIATGAACTLSISAGNATGYQWRKSGVDISGATSSSYSISAVTTTDTSSYSVRVINSASGGCASVTSNVVTVIGSTTLYSKSSGNLNLAGSWGVATDGSGSSPVDFTRSEHTFIVKNNANTGGNLTIAGILDVGNVVTTISANTTLDVRKIIRSGTGSIAGTATSNLTVRDTSNLYFQTGNDIIKDLTIQGGNINLLSTLSITGGNTAGTLAINAGTLNTNDNLTFKSNSTGTARMAALGAGATINGKSTIERYIPAARGWRYLSVPIRATGAPTINQAWQEGVTTASGSSNPYPGYGGQITGGTTTNGFDQSSTNSPSIKVYNSSTNSFTRLPENPGTNIPITNYPAYCIYLRGDRGINLMQGLNAAITSTTLRVKGQLNTGNQPVTVNGSNFTLVGNPYPSAIDFGTLTRSNVNNTMYMWDPKMAGNYGLGGYVTVSWNNVTHTYDKTASVSNVNQYVQSGEAFFISSADHINPGTLTFKESDKTSSGSDLVYRHQSTDQRLRINLYSDINDTLSLLDGVLTTYADENSNELDNDDAKKLYGSNQSINIKRNGQMLAIERRKTILANDTTYLNIYQMKQVNYKLELIAENMNEGNIIAIVKDNYSNTSNNIALDMNDTSWISFTVNGDPASYAVDRFSVVFENLGPLPVNFKTVNAQQEKKDIVIEWHTENEINIANYTVERSIDGSNFVAVATLLSKGNQLADYFWTDLNIKTGIYYYRIKSKGNAADINYSKTMKVNIAAINITNTLSIYPNPVKNDIVSLQLTNLQGGDYAIEITNLSGQVMQRKKLSHTGGIFRYTLILDSSIIVGKYQVKLTDGGALNLITSMIKE